MTELCLKCGGVAFKTGPDINACLSCGFCMSYEAGPMVKYSYDGWSKWIDIPNGCIAVFEWKEVE
jgi:ribosomal protein L37E